MGEGVAVGVAERTFGCGAHVSEDQSRRSFEGEAGEIDAIPGRRSGGEDAGAGAEDWRGVVAYAEAIAVVGTPVILERGALLRGENGEARAIEKVERHTKRRRES